MIQGITLVTLGLVLFALGMFILGCLRYVGYTPRHMVQYIDRAALVRFALRYCRDYGMRMLCVFTALTLLCI